MTVTPTSYEAIAAGNVVAMLADSVTFQMLVGAANAAAAMAFITDTWGGTPGRSGAQDMAVSVAGTSFSTATPPFALVKPDPMESTLGGVGFWTRKGTMEIVIVQARQASTGEKPPDSLQRWRNVHGGIRSDIEALFGTSSSYLATGEISGDGPIFTDDTGVDQSAIYSTLKLTWWG